jgi:hypothetical protein
MFNGDIRKARVEKVMVMASNLTVAEMKAVIVQLTQLHDSIVIAADPRWIKPDPHWEKGL